MKAAADSRGALIPSNVHRTFSVRLNRFTGTMHADLRCNMEEECRRKNKEALQLLVELLKVAATYSPTMQCSTIGDAELNDPVRNGKGWDLSAITTLIKG